MLLSISSQPSRRKNYPQRTLHLCCDVCGQKYEKQYFTHIEKAKYHSCSEECQWRAQQKGGFLDEKKRQVMLERYGVDNPQQVAEFRIRSRLTNIERYGCEIGSQSEIVKEKTRQTNRARYGVDCHTQTQEYLDKSRKTCQNRYGTNHPMQSDEIKAKYDFSDIWKKAHATKKLNGTYASSKAENRFFEKLINVFGKVERQVPVQHDHGTWLIDFKIDDVYLQFDGEYWHGLDRPLDVIKESTSPRDLMLVNRFADDRFQDAWFSDRGMKLIRITDRQAKTLSDNLLRQLLTLKD